MIKLTRREIKTKMEKVFSAVNEAWAIEYAVDLNHLKKIGGGDLFCWLIEYTDEEFA